MNNVVLVLTETKKGWTLSKVHPFSILQKIKI